MDLFHPEIFLQGVFEIDRRKGMTMIEIGVLTRMARASAIEVMRLEYVTHARAKGLAEWQVLARHVLPNAFAPTWTLVGLILGNLLGGIAVIEAVFTLPGLGRLVFQAISNRDLVVVKNVVVLFAFFVVAVNFLVDLLYAVIDPRLKAHDV